MFLSGHMGIISPTDISNLQFIKCYWNAHWCWITLSASDWFQSVYWFQSVIWFRLWIKISLSLPFAWSNFGVPPWQWWMPVSSTAPFSQLPWYWEGKSLWNRYRCFLHLPFSCFLHFPVEEIFFFLYITNLISKLFQATSSPSSLTQVHFLYKNKPKKKVFEL